MATKILDVSADALPDGVGGLQGYRSALVLVRWRGLPLGKLELPVEGGRVDGGELRDAVLAAFADTIAGFLLLEGIHPEGRGAFGARPPAMQTTIAICTRERPDDLSRCLESLMALPDDGQEIAVVDNKPTTDATREVVSRFPRARYLREDRRGLDVARNRALVEARGEVLAFIDDDAVADANWLRAIAAPFEHPLVQCVTGLTMPLELETTAQEAFERLTGFSRRGFKRLDFEAPRIHPLATGLVGAGVNMALRRSVVAEIGPFDEALDAGTPSESGGDHEYFSRVLRAGWRIVYEPAALNWHRHRKSWDELRRAMYGYGVGTYAAWTRALIVERDWRVFGLAWTWFWHDQSRMLVRSLVFRDRDLPADLLLAELRGCLAGPGAYLRARHLARLAARPRVAVNG